MLSSHFAMQCPVCKCSNVRCLVCKCAYMCAVYSVQTFCSESEAWLTREGWGLPEIGMTEAFFPENLEEGRFPHFGCFPPQTPPHLREIDPFARNPFPLPLWVIYASCYLPPGLPICSSSLWFRQQAAPVQSRGSKAHTGPRGGEGGRKWEVEEGGEVAMGDPTSLWVMSCWCCGAQTPLSPSWSSVNNVHTADCQIFLIFF